MWFRGIFRKKEQEYQKEINQQLAKTVFHKIFDRKTEKTASRKFNIFFFKKENSKEELNKMLFEGAKKNNLKMIRKALKKGININTKNRDNKNVLMLVIESSFKENSKNLKIIEYLIEKGIDINAADSLGYTPLMIAIQLGKTETAKYLIKMGANTKQKNNFGFDSFELARFSWKPAIANIFKEIKEKEEKRG